MLSGDLYRATINVPWEPLHPACPGPPDREPPAGDTLRRTRRRGTVMEVTVMSLSAHEQQALDSIGQDLSVTDPELTSLLATFTRLTAGEDMPAREKTQPPARQATRRPSRHRHRHRRPRDTARPGADRSRRLRFWQGASLVLGILFAVAVVAGAMAITHLRPGW